jgi:alpha-1,3-rhamnosyl/mannosyltransferase
VAGVLHTLRPDVYHSPYYVYPPITGGRVVVTVFDLIPEQLAAPTTPRDRARRAIYRLTLGWGARRATRIIVPSAACGADLERLHGARAKQVVRIPLGVDPTFQPVDRKSIVHVTERFDLPPRFILTVGVNKPHKNHAGLVQALKFLPSDVALVVAGPRDRRFPDARDIAAPLGVANRVVTLGAVPSADLPALYAAADAFAFPSFDEGFGLPPVEAMACGTPVACARTGSLPEVVGEAAILFDPYRPFDIAVALRTLLDDDASRRHFRRAGLERATTFRWEDVAAATWRVYWDVCSGP